MNKCSKVKQQTSIIEFAIRADIEDVRDDAASWQRVFEATRSKYGNSITRLEN